jgi:hypothetical protein
MKRFLMTALVLLPMAAMAGDDRQCYRETVATPEPATWVLMAAGLGFGVITKIRKRD